jgi:signal transduction histidine kinase
VELIKPSIAIAFFRTPGVGRKVLGLLILGFIALLVVGFSSVVVSERSKEFNRAVNHTEKVMQANRHVLELTLNAETGQRGFLLTGNRAYLDVYWPAIADMPASLDRLERLTRDNPPQNARTKLLATAVNKRIASLRQGISLGEAGETEVAIARIRTGTGRAQMHHVRLLVASIDATEARLLVVRSAAVDQAGLRNLLINVAGLVLVLAIAAASLYVFQSYVQELRRSHEAIDELNRGLEEKVVERTEALTRANDEIQRFAYIVSHDLRSPLVNVMGYTSELEQATKAISRQMDAVRATAPETVQAEAAVAVDEDIPEAIGFIRASTAKMDRLIKAILRLSRDGQRILTPELLDMGGLIDSIAKGLHAQTVSADTTITIEPLPAFVSDRLAIEQLFGNLIENAVKYMSTGRPGLVTVRGREEGDWVVYEVQDNGRGIDAKDHERVFELFRRSGLQDRPGEGMGLAFVRSTVRRLQGVLDLRSQLGEGSTFVLKFPKRLQLQESDAP